MSRCFLCDQQVNTKEVTLHVFPKNPNIRLAWIKFCELDERDDVSKIKICSKHFTKADFKVPNAKMFGGILWLKPGSIPSIPFNPKWKKNLKNRQNLVIKGQSNMKSVPSWPNFCKRKKTQTESFKEKQDPSTSSPEQLKLTEIQDIKIEIGETYIKPEHFDENCDISSTSISVIPKLIECQEITYYTGQSNMMSVPSWPNNFCKIKKTQTESSKEKQNPSTSSAEELKLTEIQDIKIEIGETYIIKPEYVDESCDISSTSISVSPKLIECQKITEYVDENSEISTTSLPVSPKLSQCQEIAKYVDENGEISTTSIRVSPKLIECQDIANTRCGIFFEPRYVGEVRSSHLAIPKLAERCFNMAKRKIYEQRVKLSKLRAENKRLLKKIAKLERELELLQERNRRTENIGNSVV